MKRIISLFLAVVMTVLSAPVFAENPDDAPQAQSDLVATSSGMTIADGAVRFLKSVSKAELLSYFNDKDAVSVYDASGAQVSDNEEMLLSGATLQVGETSLVFAVPGDANGDDTLNARDVIAAMKLSISAEAVPSVCAEAADVDDDGAINARDVIDIMKKIVGYDVDFKTSLPTAQSAESDDETLTMFFDAAMHQIDRADTTVHGDDAGLMRLARNEREDIQIVLTSTEQKEGLSLEIGALENADGAALATELRYGYYFNMVKWRQLEGVVQPDNLYGEYFVDALPMYEDGFSIGANESKAFYLSAISEADSAPGWYSASVRVLDSEGRELKRSTIRAYVWDFVLDEAPASATAFGLSIGSITEKKCQGDYTGITNEIKTTWYKDYYDMLLDNHISAYGLPYKIGDERADAYMSDPRVTSFQMGSFSDGNGGEYKVSEAELRANYEKLKTNPVWFDKSYYYDVDEPCGNGYDLVRAQWNMLCEMFPEKDFNVVVPWATNDYKTAYGMDSVDYCRGYLNIWCPQSYAWGIYYTTEERREAKKLGIELFHRGEYVNKWTDASVYKSTGGKQWAERYADLRAEGNKMWWYICESPEVPYANFFETYQGVSVRVVLWQQYMFDSDGLLYWATTVWKGVNKKRTHGDGTLIYWGEMFGQEDPVTSTRLTEIRDGIEDYQYMTQLERLTGRENAMKYVNRVTTAVLDWNEDYTNMARVRDDLGFALEAASKAN